MKKNSIIKLFFIFIILLVPVIILSAATGDVDGNGKVGASDYLLIRKHILGTSKLTGDKLTRADVNSDGKVNSTDYILIRKAIINGTSITTPTSSSPTTSPSSTTSSSPASLGSANSFEAYFLNTSERSSFSENHGNNDAFIFRTSNGKYVLLDTGKSPKEIKEAIYSDLSYLQKSEKVTIDYMIISHMHSDHYGSAKALINDNDVTIKNLIIKSDSAPGAQEKYDNIYNAAKKKKINIIDTDSDSSIKEGSYYELSSNIKMYLFNVKDVYKNEDCSKTHYTISYAGGGNSHEYVKSVNGKYLYVDGGEYLKNGPNTQYHEADKVEIVSNKEERIYSRFWVTLSHDDKMISQCNSNSNSLVVVFQYKTSAGNKYVYLPNDLQNDGYSPLGEYYDSSKKVIVHGHASTMFYKYKMVDGKPRFYLDENNQLIVNTKDGKIKKASAYLTAKNIKKKFSSDIIGNIVIHQMAHHGINGYKEVVDVLGLNSSSIYAISPSDSDPGSIISLPRSDAVYNIKKSKIMYTGYVKEDRNDGIKCVIKNNGKTSCAYYKK